MTSAFDASIIPITLTVNGRIGLTLWAPPWEDDEGEEWQGFLGDGAKILLFPSTRELADFIATGHENDLSDHPAWGRVLKLRPDDLRPSGDDAYDLDQVYEWAAAEPDPVHVSALANVVDMVEKIADCCDDGALRRLVGNTPEYVELVSEDVSYQGREGRKRWTELGDVIAETWERALTRVDSWLEWRGDFADSDLESETVWDRVGAEPIQIVLERDTFYTVRGYLDDEVVFLGQGDTVIVFTEVEDLARFCRAATEHELTRLERWGELADIEDDATFNPGLDGSYDLRTPSRTSRDLLLELAAFTNVEADTDKLAEDPDDAEVWTALVTEVASCFEQED
jgi:hypothetical protein